MTEAIVIGSGPNGLVAANKLADAGCGVLVLEAHSSPGGAVRSEELIEPGFINDHCSAFYPLGAGSPVMRSLDLENYGLRWTHAPLVLAHPSLDGSCPVISRNIDETVASLGADGDAWRRSQALWDAKGEELLEALFTTFPPVRAGLRIARGLAWKELIRLARFAVLPVRRLGEEQFERPETRRLMAGLSLHADLLPESNMSGFYGWLLASLAQSVGFPSPEGGAGNLSVALVRRLESKGGEVRCNAPVSRVLTRSGRAVGVQLEDGEKLFASRAVLADVDAPRLFRDMLPVDEVPDSVLLDIDRFQWDSATVKIDWNLDGPVPWSAKEARRAGTVHIAESIDELSITSSELARGVLPTDPFLLFGQQSMGDRTRQPAGKETAWAYTHVPQGALLSEDEAARYVDLMEERVEALAPGFRSLVRGRLVSGPTALENDNSNLVHGALGGGTSQLHQQLVFRPVPGTGRPETFVRDLYLASSSAHPGGGVHGACGANAAHAALLSPARRKLVSGIRWVGERQTANKIGIVP